MKQFIINENDSGQRLDKFIGKAVPQLPKSLMYKYIRLKRIKLNGKRCERAQMLCCGDVLDMYVNDEFFSNENRSTELKMTDGKPDIVYEDNNIIIVWKPVGTDVHQGSQKPDDTLIDMVTAYLFSKGEYKPDEENSFAPALCNRIDRNTSGLVVCAKNAAALREMNEYIRLRRVKKQYLCICVGSPDKRHSLESAYHCKTNRNKVLISKKPFEGYKKITTEYTVEKKKGELSLLRVNLITGRTHQIRAHLAFLGIPILGDGKYGNVKMNKKYGIFTQQLCAYSVRFDFDNEGVLGYLSGKKFSADKTGFKIGL